MLSLCSGKYLYERERGKKTFDHNPNSIGQTREKYNSCPFILPKNQGDNNCSDPDKSKEDHLLFLASN